MPNIMMINKSDPKTDPWGTPDLTGMKGDSWSSPRICFRITFIIIMMFGIDKSIVAAYLSSFADDTRI
jgi:hypothetical protein